LQPQPSSIFADFATGFPLSHLSGRGHLKMLAPSVRGGSDLFGLWKWQTGQQNVSIIGNLGSN